MTPMPGVTPTGAAQTPPPMRGSKRKGSISSGGPLSTGLTADGPLGCVPPLLLPCLLRGRGRCETRCCARFHNASRHAQLRSAYPSLCLIVVFHHTDARRSLAPTARA
jgi:hypothetical protein